MNSQSSARFGTVLARVTSEDAPEEMRGPLRIGPEPFPFGDPNSTHFDKYRIDCLHGNLYYMYAYAYARTYSNPVFDVSDLDNPTQTSFNSLLISAHHLSCR